MEHKEFEDLLRKHSFQDQEFFEYLQENPIEELTFFIEEEEVQKETGKFTILEDSVLDYLEECCSYDADFVIEEREAKLAMEMKKVLYYAFFYLKEGISYMDLVQEGIIGLLKGIDSHSTCLDAWAVREIFTTVQDEIQNLKFGFKSFLKGKREDVEQKEQKEQKEHSCCCGHHENQHAHDKGEELEKEGTLDKNQTLEKLLESDTVIDEMERIIEDSLDFRTMKYRLYRIEIEVLNYYFGLMVDRRYSIFEIEEKFCLPKEHAQNIFENAMYKLSTVKGKVEL